MQPPIDKTNADQAKTLLDLVRADGGEDGLGAAMLRLAQMAAAQHRANKRPKQVKPWSDVESIELSFVQDLPGNGFPAMARSARDSGPVTTEGDR